MLKELVLNILSQIQSGVKLAVNAHAAGGLTQKTYYSFENLSTRLLEIARATYDQPITSEQLIEQLHNIATRLNEFDETQATEWVKSLGEAIKEGKNIPYALDAIKEVMEHGKEVTEHGAEETTYFIDMLKASQKYIKKNDFLQLLFKGFSIWKSTNLIIGLLQEAVDLQKDKDTENIKSNEQLIGFYIAMVIYIGLLISPVLKKIINSAEQANSTITNMVPSTSKEDVSSESSESGETDAISSEADSDSIESSEPDAVPEPIVHKPVPSVYERAKSIKQKARTTKVDFMKYQGLMQLGAAVSAKLIDIPGIQEGIEKCANQFSLFYTVTKLIPDSIDILHNPIPRQTALLVAETLWTSVTTCTQKSHDVPTNVRLTKQSKRQSLLTAKQLFATLKQSKHYTLYANIYRQKPLNLRPHNQHNNPERTLNNILNAAVINKDLPVIKAVINTQGYNPENHHNLAFALISAITTKNDECIQAILEHCEPADVNYSDRKKPNNTALIMAVINNCSLKIITDMIENYSADINHTNIEGKTALFYAIEQGNKELVAILLAKGADINVVPEQEKSLLDIAIRLDNGTAEILQEYTKPISKRKH